MLLEEDIKWIDKITNFKERLESLIDMVEEKASKSEVAEIESRLMDELADKANL